MSAVYIVVSIDEEGYGSIEHTARNMKDAHLEAVRLQQSLRESDGKIDIFRISVPDYEPLDVPEIDLLSRHPLSGGW